MTKGLKLPKSCWWEGVSPRPDGVLVTVGLSSGLGLMLASKFETAGERWAASIPDTAITAMVNTIIARQ